MTATLLTFTQPNLTSDLSYSKVLGDAKASSGASDHLHAHNNGAGSDKNDVEELSGNAGSEIRDARCRERSRIRAILECEAAQSNLALAVALACHSTLTRNEAVKTLKAALEMSSSGRKSH